MPLRDERFSFPKLMKKQLKWQSNRQSNRCLSSLHLFTGLALLLGGNLSAGEQVVFSNSKSKILVPREKFRDEDSSSEGFDKKHNSVEPVMAPWQNPIHSRSSIKQKRELLKALSREQNWMFQDHEELLNSSSRRSDLKLDDAELSELSELSDTRRSFRQSARTALDRDSLNVKSEDRLRIRKRSSRISNRDEMDRKGDFDEEMDHKPKDIFASPRYFDAEFRSIFDPPENANRIGESSKDRALEAASSQSLGGLAGAFPLETQMSFAETQQKRSADFERLLNPSPVNSALEINPNPDLGIIQRGSTGLSPIANAPIASQRSPVLDAFRPNFSESIRPSIRADVFGSASASALDPANLTRKSIQNRPAIFEVPKRSF